MTSPSVGKWHQDFTVPLRSQGDRSYKNSGRLSSLPILAPTSLSSSVTWTLSTRSSRGPTRFALPSSTKTPGSRLACRLIGGGTFTDEHVLRTMGDEVLGVIT